MTSEPEKQTTAIQILSDISSIKSIKEMKFGQLIKYKIETYFLKNHEQNVVENYSQNLFKKI